MCAVSGDWDKLQIPNLVQISLIKCYWMLHNFRGTTFAVSELWRENQRRTKLSPLTKIKVKKDQGALSELYWFLLERGAEALGELNDP